MSEDELQGETEEEIRLDSWADKKKKGQIGDRGESQALTTPGCPVFVPLFSDWGCMS